MKSLLVAATVGLMLASLPAGTTPNGGGAGPCATGFAPGPVVGGRHRQPTGMEVEARTQELHMQSVMNDVCRVGPGGRQQDLNPARRLA